MKMEQSGGVWRKALAFITAISLVIGSAAPATAQSFRDIIGRDRRDGETRARKMTPAALADARSAKQLFARLGAVQSRLGAVAPLPAGETYNPKNPKRAAQLKAELQTALDAYDTATIAEERAGVPVPPALLARLRNAVAPFVRFLDKMQATQGVRPALTLAVLPGQVRTFDLSAYCMDSSLGTPKSGETFRLYPASRLLPPELTPLYSSIMANPGRHSTETQGLVWALRNAYRSGTPVTLAPDAIQRLETQYPGAAQAIASYNRRTGNAKAVRGLLDAVLPGARNLVSQVQALDPRRMIEDTAAQIANLERIPVAGTIDPDAAYTTLAPGIAAKATSPWGGLSRAQVSVANTTDRPYTFQPQQWVATSPRPSQHLALQIPAGYSSNQAGNGLGLPLATLVSAGLDTSVLGNIKAAIQVITGRDLITGEEIDRWMEITSILPVVGQGLRLEKRAARISKELRASNPQFAQRYTANRTAIERQLSQQQIKWPPNRGFLKDPSREVLKPGTMVDRYGYNGGTFVSPLGTPATMRSLAPGTTAKPYKKFRVIKPLPVDSGMAAPWFGEAGLGTQYDLPMSIEDAIKQGFIEEIT